MKIVCDGLDLSDAVIKVSKAISNKNVNPILEGIKISTDEDYLILTATDLELTIENKIRADVKIDGDMVVPGKFFGEYIKKLNNEKIELTTDDSNNLSIRYADSFGKIQCYDAKEYPITQKIDFENSFEISQKDLKDLITKTVYAVSVDETRPILKGVKLEVEDGNVTAIALDGFRLSKTSKVIHNATNNVNIIVPAKSLKEISNLLSDSDDNVKISIQKNYLMVELQNTKISTRLLDGEFINYKQIIPTAYTTTVIINKAQLENSIDKAMLFSRVDKNNLVKFDITEKLMLIASHSEIGENKDNISIHLNGKELTIAFNARYFSEALRVIDDEYIKLNFNSSISPCVITASDNESFTNLILPVRISN
ncbi:MAG: DNA polymerase III subunit beta [Clostridiales bacterium]|nr:DNA polymerase III subunit beta [Clostridiales bacterium]